MAMLYISRHYKAQTKNLSLKSIRDIVVHGMLVLDVNFDQVTKKEWRYYGKRLFAY